MSQRGIPQHHRCLLPLRNSPQGRLRCFPYEPLPPTRLPPQPLPPTAPHSPGNSIGGGPVPWASWPPDNARLASNVGKPNEMLCSRQNVVTAPRGASGGH